MVVVDGGRKTRFQKLVDKLAGSGEALSDIKTRVESTAAQTPVNETIVNILAGAVKKKRKETDEFHPTSSSSESKG